MSAKRALDTALLAALQAVREDIDGIATIRSLRELASNLGVQQAKEPTFRAMKAVLAQHEWPDRYKNDKEAWIAHRATYSNYRTWKKKIFPTADDQVAAVPTGQADDQVAAVPTGQADDQVAAVDQAELIALASSLSFFDLEQLDLLGGPGDDARAAEDTSVEPMPLPTGEAEAALNLEEFADQDRRVPTPPPTACLSARPDPLAHPRFPSAPQDLEALGLLERAPMPTGAAAEEDEDEADASQAGSLATEAGAESATGGGEVACAACDDDEEEASRPAVPPVFPRVSPPPPATATATLPLYPTCARKDCRCVSWNQLPGHFCCITCRGTPTCPGRACVHRDGPPVHHKPSADHRLRAAPSDVWARCIREGCPCVASFDGQPGHYCCASCRDGTPCAANYHFEPQRRARKDRRAGV